MHGGKLRLKAHTLNINQNNVSPRNEDTNSNFVSGISGIGISLRHNRLNLFELR